MPFESLETELAGHLAAICEAQMSGQFDPRMVYQPGKGLRANSRTGGDPKVISTDIDRSDLRALATHDYISLATPRAHWFVVATAKALTEFSDD